MAFVFQKDKKESTKEEKLQLSFFKRAIVYQGNLIMVLTAMAIVIGGYFLIIVPQVEAIISETSTIDSLVSEINSLDIQLKRFKNLEQEYNNVSQEKIAKVESLVTVSPDLPNLYIQLEALAKQNNLELSSIKADSAKAVSEVIGLGIVKVNLKIGQGDYGSLKKFLAALENNLRIFDIQTLSFPEKIDSFDIELSAYYIQ
jgi:Tfp pilus assembly protein PilO